MISAHDAIGLDEDTGRVCLWTPDGGTLPLMHRAARATTVALLREWLRLWLEADKS